MPIVLSIEVEGTLASATREGIATIGRTIDEKISFYVHKGISLGVSTHDIAAILPVIHDVIHILVDAFYLIVTSSIVNIQITIKGNII